MGKRALRAVILAAFAVVLCTACGYTKEEKKAMRRYEKQGKENAVNYIEEKYGFKADVENVVCEKMDMSLVPDFWPSPSGCVFADMTYKGEKFHVYITGEVETTDGADDYQFDEVLNAFAEEMNEITGLEAEDVVLCYGIFSTVERKRAGNGMIREFYDGTNLAEVLGINGFSAVCSYIEKDLSKLKEDPVGKFIDGSFLLVSYNSREDFRSCGSRYYNVAGYPIDSDIDREAIYIREYRLMNQRTDEYIVYDVQEYDGFYYVTYGGEAVYIGETEVDSADSWNGRGYIEAKQVMEGYSLETDADTVLLFIPVDRVKASGKDKASIAVQYMYDGLPMHGNALTFMAGEDAYYTTKLYMNQYEDLKFTVLISTK